MTMFELHLRCTFNHHLHSSLSISHKNHVSRTASKHVESCQKKTAGKPWYTKYSCCTKKAVWAIPCHAIPPGHSDPWLGAWPQRCKAMRKGWCEMLWTQPVVIVVNLPRNLFQTTPIFGLGSCEPAHKGLRFQRSWSTSRSDGSGHSCQNPLKISKLTTL